MTTNVIDKSILFAMKTVDNATRQYATKKYPYSNKVVGILLSYAHSVIEIYIDYDSHELSIVHPDVVLDITLHHRYEMELLGCGLYRIYVSSVWWFDIYTNIPDDLFDFKLKRVVELESKANDDILLLEDRICQELQDRIDMMKDIIREKSDLNTSG